MQKELLRMENIVKTFPGVKALNNAAITVHAGEVMGFKVRTEPVNPH